VATTVPDEQLDLLDLVAGVVRDRIAPRAAGYEAEHTFPREQFDLLASLDLTRLPFPEDVGGLALPYRTYLLVLEELARGHATVALAVSVSSLAAVALERFGTDEQRQTLARPIVEGAHLGAYSLSEPQAGSDAASLACRAVRDGDVYRLTGQKAWVTHGGVADRYVVFARTGDAGAAGVSAFAVDADQDGMTVLPPEAKMGLTGSPTSMLGFEQAPVPADRLVGGEEGIGFRIAMSALDGGRLGISAISVGVAQAALDAAVAYAREREQFGRRIIDFQGVSFLLADMATRVEAARALYRDAADRRDRTPGGGGSDVSTACSMAKLFCTDTAMQVTTDAVQVLGGVGYTRDFPVERYMREAKVMQIFEGTNQIQRLLIGRHLQGRD
jgi:alkylation response protein AidB-like acyl-CoA dehydrogenase